MQGVHSSSFVFSKCKCETIIRWYYALHFVCVLHSFYSAIRRNSLPDERRSGLIGPRACEYHLESKMEVTDFQICVKFQLNITESSLFTTLELSKSLLRETYKLNFLNIGV